MGHPTLDPLAARLETDLRRRFPDVRVGFELDDDGTWMVVVTDGGAPWGSASTWFESDDVLDDAGTEGLMVDVATTVFDNLWPDDLHDPWPRCPVHGDHSLSIAVHLGRASWVCLHGRSVSARVGDLADLLELRGGLPDGWESVAARLARDFGHDVVLTAVPPGFDPAGDLIAVHVDGAAVGSFGFTYRPSDGPAAVLRDLRQRIEEVVAEELGPGRHP